MSKLIFTLFGAALIVSLASPEAFAKQHHVRNTNAPAYALPQAAPGAPDGTDCASMGMYSDNDPNVYRDGQCRDDVNPHGG
jgi:hypothetical protein